MQAMNGVPYSTAWVPRLGLIGFRVHSTWRGGVRSRSTVDSFTTDAHRVRRLFTISADEPFERGGHNTAPNPQELLIAALNACLVARYATAAAVNGIALERLDIETSGELHRCPPIETDQMGSPGFESLRCTVRIKGNATPERFRELHETAMCESPNFFSLSLPVRVETTLEVEG